MTTVGADESAQAGTPVAVEPQPATASAPAADPAALGLPCFIMGAVALGLTLVGVVPAAAVGSPLPIILGATSAGLFITTVWAAALGQTAVASVFGIFATFWLSYFLLVIGLIRSWFGITAAEATATEELFLITWLVIVVMLILATLRLPLAFTAVFILVGLTVLLVLLGTETSSAGLIKSGGYFLLAAAAGGVYLFFNSLSLATGGTALPLGRPAQHG